MHEMTPAAARKRRIALVLFLLFVAAAGFFGLRAAMFAFHWATPANIERPLEPWMTIRYVARSHDVDALALAGAVGVTPRPGQRRTLRDLAAERGESYEVFAARIEAELARMRADD